jgi:hypothetical protein
MFGWTIAEQSLQMFKNIWVLSVNVFAKTLDDKLVEWNHVMHPCFGVALVCNNRLLYPMIST